MNFPPDEYDIAGFGIERHKSCVSLSSEYVIWLGTKYSKSYKIRI